MGVLWNVVCSQNFAHLLSTCFNNSYRWRGFNSHRRQRHLQGGSRPVIFYDIYKSGFLPPLQSLDLNGTFSLGRWRGVIPLMQCLSQHCLGYLSTAMLNRFKIWGHPGSNGFPKKPHSCSLTSKTSTPHIWTCTSPPHDCSYHGYLFFFFYTLVNIRKYLIRVTLFSWIPTYVKQIYRKIGQYIDLWP